MNEPPKVRYWKDWGSWATYELEVGQFIVVHNEWTKGSVTMGQLLDELCINLGKFDDLGNEHKKQMT